METLVLLENLVVSSPSSALRRWYQAAVSFEVGVEDDFIQGAHLYVGISLWWEFATRESMNARYYAS